MDECVPFALELIRAFVLLASRDRDTPKKLVHIHSLRLWSTDEDFSTLKRAELTLMGELFDGSDPHNHQQISGTLSMHKGEGGSWRTGTAFGTLAMGWGYYLRTSYNSESGKVKVDVQAKSLTGGKGQESKITEI